MKNKYFNVKLFLDAIRQLKIIGIMGAVIMCIAAVLVPVGYSITISGAERVSRYSVLLLNPVLMCVFFIFAPAMIISIFKFVNRRNASDFFHSLPIDRRCLYLSYMAAVISWLAGIIVLSTLVSMLVIFLLPNIEVITGSVVIYMFTCFAASVLVSCVFGLGVALSGTMFTNFTASVIILFTPRIISYIVIVVLRQTLVFADFNHMNSIFSNSMNIVTDFILNMNNITAIMSVRSGAYTLVLGLIYLFLGMSAFRKRKSETASQPAENRVLQTIFRIVPALVISLIASSIVFLNITSLEDYFGLSDSWFSVLVVYILAIIAYFMYEVISTRKLKSVIKAIPGLILLIVLNILYMVAMEGASIVIKNDKPSFRDINSVAIVMANNDAVIEQIEDAKITDENILKMISHGLEDSINMLEDGNISPYDYEYNELSGYNVIEVAIEKKHETIYRKIALTDSDYAKLFDYLTHNDKLKNMYYKALDCTLDDSDIVIYDNYLNEDDMMKIYESFQEEAKTVDFSIIFNMLNNNYYPQGYSMPISIEYSYKGNSYYLDIPVTEDFPKTYAMYINLINQKNGIDVNVITSLLNEDYKSIFTDAPDITNGYIVLDFYTADYETNFSMYCDIENGNLKSSSETQMLALLENLAAYMNTDGEVATDNLSQLVCLEMFIDGTDTDGKYYENEKKAWYSVGTEGRKLINDITLLNN